MPLEAFALFPVALQLHQAGHEIEGPMAIRHSRPVGLIDARELVANFPPLAARWLPK